MSSHVQALEFIFFKTDGAWNPSPKEAEACDPEFPQASSRAVTSVFWPVRLYLKCRWMAPEECPGLSTGSMLMHRHAHMKIDRHPEFETNGKSSQMIMDPSEKNSKSQYLQTTTTKSAGWKPLSVFQNPQEDTLQQSHSPPKYGRNDM